MPNDFKKFISTGGKSLDDIKKEIEKMLSKTAKAVVRDVEKEVKKEVKSAVRNVVKDVLNTSARAEKIPPRRENFFSDSKNSRREIVIEADEIAYPPEHIEENLSPHDIAINEKILGMRKKKETSYNGYIVQRCAEITFVLQGEFVADVEDDYSRCAFFGMTTPLYAAMSNSQLRTYFTWRTDARRGIFRETDKAYVVLYVFELLNKIGVRSSDEAFSKLLELWEKAKFAKYLNDILPRWLKDFYAFNNVSCEFPELESYLGENNGKSENTARKAAVEISRGNYKNKLNFLADNSVYNIKGSSFYNEKTAEMIDGALEKVLCALGKFSAEKGVALDALLCGQMKKDYGWRAFSGAVVNLDRMDGFRAVKISPEESYCIKRGEPALEEYSLQLQRGIIGFILKTTEAKLRVRTGFCRKITVNPAMLSNDVKNREKAAAVVLSDEFVKIIENTADKYCDENGIFPQKKPAKDSRSDSAGCGGDVFVYEQKRVEIDVSKLAEIREQADEIARKLIVDDNGENTVQTEPQYDLSESIEENEIEDKARQISEEDFSEKISEYSELSGFSGLSEQQDGWAGFAGRLSENERGVLAAVFENSDCAGFCRERGLLPETVFEKINALALEFVGDIVIENGEIIPDYRQEIAEIVLEN